MALELATTTHPTGGTGDTFLATGNPVTGAQLFEFPAGSSSNLTGVGINSTITRTSDTNAYTAGDVIGPATGSTAAQVLTGIGIAGKLLTIMDVNLMIEVAAIPSGMTSFTMELYNITPPSALGDNAAWTLASGDWASYLGYIDLGNPVVRGGCLYIQNSGINKTVLLSSANLYYYFKTNGAYTPTSAAVKLLAVSATVI